MKEWQSCGCRVCRMRFCGARTPLLDCLRGDKDGDEQGSLAVGETQPPRHSFPHVTHLAMDGHHSLPIHARPPRTWRQWLNGALFYLSFITGFTVIHAFQLLFLLPLKLIPGRWAGVTYDHGIRYTKGSFAILLSKSWMPSFWRHA